MQHFRLQAWAILILASIFIGFGVFFVVRNMARFSDGAYLDPGEATITNQGLKITTLVDKPGELRTGDIVTSIEGQSISTLALSLFGAQPSAAWPAGKNLVYEVIRAGKQERVEVSPVPFPLLETIRRNWGTILFALVSMLVSGLIFFNKPDLAAGQALFLGAAGLLSSSTWSIGLTLQDFTDGLGFWLYKITSFWFYGLYWISGFHFALLFPRPFRIAGKRWFVIALYVVPYIFSTVYIVAIRNSSETILGWFAKWTQPESLLAAVFLLATMVTFVLQMRRSTDQQTRQQIRWVIFAGITAGSAGLLLYLLPPLIGFASIHPNLIGIVVLPFPVAIAIGVLRHNLFNIDLLINRALVYSLLTTITILIYVLLVGYVGDLLTTGQQSLIAFLTTGIVAVIFQPMRVRLQQWVNNLMYGNRDDPYLVLTTLGRNLEKTGASQDVVPNILATVAQTLRLPYTAIELSNGQTTSFGVIRNKSVTQQFPLIHQGRTFGRLIVSQRSETEHFSIEEDRLLRDLARQIEVAVHNVQLTSDLRNSRQLIVSLREEERRRIRRDLHDGLGPHLASQMLSLEAIDKLINTNPERAKQLLKDLRSQSQKALSDIRRLIYDLRPPTLDDLGLAAAIQQHLKQNAPELDVKLAVDPVQNELPAAVEVAAYRIIQEAVNNVRKHAQALVCVVRVQPLKENLLIQIEDDGIGIPEKLVSGLGMQTMRERAEELGGRFEILSPASGGTIVRAEIPTAQGL